MFLLRHADRTGAPKLALAYQRALVAAGHQVHLVYGAEAPRSADGQSFSFMQDYEAAGISVERVPRLVRGGLSPLLVREIVSIVKRQRIDLVVGVTQRDRPTAAMVGRVAGIPVVVLVLNQQRFSGRLAPLKRVFYKATVPRFSSGFVASTELIAAELEQAMGVGADRTVVIPNAINVPPAAGADSKERAGAFRSQLGVEESAPLVVNASRYDPQKGLDVLVRAFGTMSLSGPGQPAPHLVIVGDADPATPALSARVRAAVDAEIHAAGLADRVHLVGYRSDLPDIMAAADLYAHSSLWEGFPLAILDAMAAGLPVVYTDCAGSLPGFVDGEHGAMVGADSAPELAAAMTRLLQLPAHERHTIGAQGRRLVEDRYSVAVTGAQFVDYVEAVAKR